MSTPSEATIRPRKPYLDILRCIAIISVVFLHVHQRIPLSFPRWVFLPGVPIFLIISGGLIIPRAAQMNMLQFARKYRGRILQFICLIPICGIITNTLVWYCMGNDLTLRQANRIPSYAEHISAGTIPLTEILVKSFTSANGIYPRYFRILDSHTWYLYLITVLYIASPFLAFLFNKLKNRTMLILLLLYLTCLFLIRYLGFEESLKPVSSLASYSFYFLLGYFLIEKNLFAKGTRMQYSFFALGVLILICYCSMALIGCNLSTIQFFTPLFICITLTLICRDYLSSFSTKFIKKLSECSFGIYLWHFVVLWVATIYFPVHNKPGTFLFLSYFLLSLFIPLIITNALRKIPFLRWLVN